MQPFSIYPLLLEPLALLLLLTTCSGFRAFSHTLSYITQQPETSEAEVARLASQLKSSSEEERRDAAMQLSVLKSDRANATLASAVTDTAARVRASVVSGLARQGHTSSIPLLAGRLKQDKDIFVRKTAAYALAGFQGSERTLALTSALQDKDAEVRAAAASALGDHADAEAITALSTALADKSDFVRARASYALGVNGRMAVSAVAKLIELLSVDKDNEVRRQAAGALGSIGDRAALPALERARHDKDPYLVQAAAEAIKLIERP